jgi:hypothetical protein
MQIEPKPETKHKTDIIMAMMRETPIGAVLTYQTMTERLNEPVVSQHSALRSALDAAKGEGMVFLNVSTLGYRRLSDADTIDVGGTKHRQKVFRGAKRWLRTITSGVRDWSTLNGEQRLRAAAQRAVAETVATNTHGNSLNARINADRTKPSAVDSALDKMRRQS